MTYFEYDTFGYLEIAEKENCYKKKIKQQNKTGVLQSETS